MTIALLRQTAVNAALGCSRREHAGRQSWTLGRDYVDCLGCFTCPDADGDADEMTDGTSSSTTPTVVRLAEYTKAEQVQILGDDADPFGVSMLGLAWQPKDVHFGIWQAGRLVAHAGLLQVPVSIGPVRTEVVGVGGVAVAPELRGRGLARLVVSEAVDHARTMGPQHGLLFCRPPAVPLYQRLGWRTLEEDVHVEQSDGPVIMPLRTLWMPLREGGSWPAGEVRLLSLPM